MTAAISVSSIRQLTPAQSAALSSEVSDRAVATSTTTASREETHAIRGLSFSVPYTVASTTQISDSRVVVIGETSTTTVQIYNPEYADAAEEIDRRLIPGENIFSYDKLMREPFFEQVISTYPDDVSLFAPSSDIAERTILLALKASFIPDSVRSIQRFTTEHLRGYQVGDPTQTEQVVLYTFLSSGDAYQVIVHGLSQQEIDAIIRSMRRS